MTTLNYPRPTLPDDTPTKLLERLEALEETGWKLIVAEPARTEEVYGFLKAVGAKYEAERLQPNGPNRQTASSLEKLVDVLEWETGRLKSLAPTSAPRVVSGAVGTADAPARPITDGAPK